MEPEDKDPDACHIGFRMPGTGDRVNRRFLKTDKVQLMYDFIDSMGDKLELEHGNSYEIMQTMPRKVFSNREKTLAEEGLFPRAMLVVKECD